MPVIVTSRTATVQPVAHAGSTSMGELFVYEGVTYCVDRSELLSDDSEGPAQRITLTAGAVARLGLVEQNGQHAAEADQATRIRAVCDELRELLLRKNASYGNSAGNPMRVFSTAGTVEGLRVRIDDKLSRLSRGTEYANEDTLLDLAGYLVLLLIETRKAAA